MFQFTAIQAPQKLNEKLAVYYTRFYTQQLSFFLLFFVCLFVSPTLALIPSTKTKKPWIGN